MTNFKRKKTHITFLFLSLLLINKIISFNIFLVEKINKNVVQISRLGVSPLKGMSTIKEPTQLKKSLSPAASQPLKLSASVRVCTMG